MSYLSTLLISSLLSSNPVISVAVFLSALAGVLKIIFKKDEDVVNAAAKILNWLHVMIDLRARELVTIYQKWENIYEN